MKNNKLISYKESIFTRISKFFKKLFFRGKQIVIKGIDEKTIYDKKLKDNFMESLLMKENEEEKRLKSIQVQYDNGEIDEDDISEEDMDKLIEMYEKETEKLNADTEIRKNHIAQMLKELKSS